MPTLALLTETETSPVVTGFGALRTATGNLPLFALDVRGRIDGLATQVEVSQSFRNLSAQPIEAVYIFPLPDRLAVREFTLQVGERIIHGELQERGQARATYAEAKAAGHQAALAEEERPGVFTMSVGNLPAHATATVRLTLVGALPCTNNEVTFRFPLVVAERYMPGKALAADVSGTGIATDTDAVPDAARISPPVLLPGCPNPVRLSLTLDLHPVAGVPITEVRSSLHSVLDLANETGVRRIILQPGERLDRDFVLRYRLGDAATQAAVTGVPDAATPTSGIASVLVLPPTESASVRRPRDVVVLLDRSGSMDGWKMLTARRAVAQIVATFTPADRVTLLAFDSDVTGPKDLATTQLHSATERTRFVLQMYLDTIDANGGTELAAPLQMAVHLLSGNDPQRDRVLLLLTDGQVGNEDQLLHSIRDQVQHLRIFTVGIDRAVNEGFLRRLAEWGRGAYTLVESAERLDAALASVHQQIGTPVLTDVQLVGHGLTLMPDTQVPARCPDLFAGAHLALWLAYTDATPDAAIEVRGRTADGAAWSTRLPVQPSASPAIPAAWARGRVRALEDAYAAGGDRVALERALVETSLRYRVLCRFTAFVAVDRSTVVNPGGIAPTITQAVEDSRVYSKPVYGFATRLQPGLSQLSSASHGGYGAAPVRPSVPVRELRKKIAQPPAPTPSVPLEPTKAVDSTTDLDPIEHYRVLATVESQLSEFTDTQVEFTETELDSTKTMAGHPFVPMITAPNDRDRLERSVRDMFAITGLRLLVYCPQAGTILLEGIRFPHVRCIVLTSTGWDSLNEIDCDHLRLFIKSGGRMIVLADSTQSASLTNINQLLSEFGMVLHANRAADCVLAVAAIAPELAIANVALSAPVVVQVIDNQQARLLLTDLTQPDTGHLAIAIDDKGDVLAGGPTNWWDGSTPLTPEQAAIVRWMLTPTR